MSRLVAQVVLLLLAVGSLTAYPTQAARILQNDGQELDLFFMVQFWNIATFDALDGDSNAVADRFDHYIRRGRLGIQGRCRPEVSFVFNFAYDNIGKDGFTAATGTPQATNNKEFYLWDGFVTVALDPTWANLTMGYFRPQVGRESITSAFKVNSFIKAPANSWPRRHIVGRGPGRETGLNLGGLYLAGDWSVNYNFGVFDTNHETIIGHGGRHWAPLLTWRLAFSLGDPEMSRYGLGYTTNYFSERNGITVAANGTRQGQTNQTAEDGEYVGGFKRNTMFGFDLLANVAGFNFGLEYDTLERECDCFGVMCEGLSYDPSYELSLWHLRGSYNFVLPNDQI
ncbi:MAG: porin, partial [bacterium]